MDQAKKHTGIFRTLANATASVSDLKRNPGMVFKAARDQQILVLNHNRPVAYILSPEAWAGVWDLLNELEDDGAAKEKLRMLGLR